MGVNYALAKWPRAEASSNERYHRRRSTDNYLIKSPALLPNWSQFVCPPRPRYENKTGGWRLQENKEGEESVERARGQGGQYSWDNHFPTGRRVGASVRPLRVVANLSPF